MSNIFRTDIRAVR